MSFNLTTGTAGGKSSLCGCCETLCTQKKIASCSAQVTQQRSLSRYRLVRHLLVSHAEISPGRLAPINSQQQVKQCPKDSKQQVNDKWKYTRTGAARCLLPVLVLADASEDAGKEQANRFPRELHSAVCTSCGPKSMAEKDSGRVWNSIFKV